MAGEILRVPFEELQKVRFTVNITQIVRATLASLFELYPKVALRLEYVQAHDIVQKVVQEIIEGILCLPSEEGIVYECKMERVEQTPPLPDREYILLIEAYKKE